MSKPKWEVKADNIVAWLGKVGLGLTMMFTFPILIFYFFGFQTWALIVAGLFFVSGIS